MSYIENAIFVFAADTCTAERFFSNSGKYTKERNSPEKTRASLEHVVPIVWPTVSPTVSPMCNAVAETAKISIYRQVAPFVRPKSAPLHRLVLPSNSRPPAAVLDR